MRFVYLHQYFVTPAESGGTRSFEVARRLAAEGHEVHVVTSDRSPHARRWRSEEISGFKVHFAPVRYDSGMSMARRMWAFISFAFRSAWKSRRLRGDVVIATSTPLTIAIPGIFASIGRCPFVFEVRDLWPEVPIAINVLRGPLKIRAARLLERFAYAQAELIVALSPGMAAGVLRVNPSANVCVVPNGCDLDIFDVEGLSGEKFRAARYGIDARKLVIYAGSFGYVNRVSYLVDLAVEMLDLAPEVRFLAVGSGPQFDLVVDEARLKGVLNRNLFIEPSMPKSQVASVFSAATASISLFIPLPELESNSANKVFDSFAAGTPVVINYGGWQSDLLARSGAGIRVDSFDIALAARTLNEFLQDDEALERASLACRHLASGEFERSRLTSKFMAAVVQVV
jgi:glycosyltransferase involved in cell wall biosynthesis